MLSYLFSLTVLCAAVIIIRALFRRRVPQRLICALWLCVLVRMVLPFPLFTVDIPESFVREPSAAAFSEETANADTAAEDLAASPNPAARDTAELSPLSPQTVFQPAETVSDAESISAAQNSSIEGTAPPVQVIPTVETAVLDSSQSSEHASDGIRLSGFLYTVWISGAVLCGAWFALSAVRFDRRLKRDRQYLRTVGHTKIYFSAAAPTPCVTGLRPVIYLPPDYRERPNPECAMALLHEYLHLRRGDPFWNIVRCAVTSVFWWHPLIHVCVFLSRRDAELACDERAAELLSPKNRLRYASLILAEAEHKTRAGALTAAFSADPVKERIVRLTTPAKNRGIAAVLAVTLTLAAAGCSLGGVEKASDVSDTDDLPDADRFAALSVSDSGFSAGVVGRMYETMTYPIPASLSWNLCPLPAVAGETQMVSYPFTDRYRVYVTYTPHTDDRGNTAHRDVLLAVIDTQNPGEAQTSFMEYLDTTAAPTSIAYTPDGNTCILYAANENGTTGNAYAVTANPDGTLSCTETAPDAYPETVAYSVRRTSPDGSVTVTEQDNGFTVTCANGRETHFSGGEVFRGFTDENRVLYALYDGETPAGWGIYDAQTDTDDRRAETGTSALGAWDGTVYIERNTFVGGVPRQNAVYAVSADGEERLLAVCRDGTSQDTDAGVYTFSKSDRLVFEEGIWLHYDVRDPETDLQAHYFGEDVHTVRCLSPDLSETYLVTYAPFDETYRDDFWRYDLVRCGDVLTLVYAACDQRTITPEETVLWEMPVDGYKNYLFCCASPETPSGMMMYFDALYESEKEPVPDRSGTYYMNEVEIPDGIPYDGITVLPYVSVEERRSEEAQAWYFCLAAELRYRGEARYLRLYRRTSAESAPFCVECELTEEEYLAYERLAYPDGGAAGTVSSQMTVSGPYTPYLASLESNEIELYTAEGGAYIASIPWDIIADFPANDRSTPEKIASWEPHWLSWSAAYYAEYGDTRWAVLTNLDTSLGTAQKNAMRSTDGGKTWQMLPEPSAEGSHPGVMTGAGFASADVAFVGYAYSMDAGPEILRTADGGETWERLTLPLPDGIAAYAYDPLVPIFDGAVGTYPVRAYMENGGRRILYFVTDDYGMTWQYASAATEDGTDVPRADITVLSTEAFFGESVPDTEESVLFTSAPVGGIPRYVVYRDDPAMVFWWYNQNIDLCCRASLSLPDNYENGYLFHGSAGGGSGEVNLFVMAERWDTGETVYLQYAMPPYSFGDSDTSLSAVVEEVTEERFLEPGIPDYEDILARIEKRKEDTGSSAGS